MMFPSGVSNGESDCIDMLLHVRPKGFVEDHYLRINDESSHKASIPCVRTCRFAVAYR